MQGSGNLEAAGSGNNGTERPAADDLTEAAASSGGEVQHSAVRGGTASCSNTGNQPMQLVPSACDGERCGTVGKARVSRKRSAAAPLWQAAAKRQAGVGLQGSSAAMPLRRDIDTETAEAGSSADGSALNNDLGVVSMQLGCEQQRVLQARKGKGKLGHM